MRPHWMQKRNMLNYIALNNKYNYLLIFPNDTEWLKIASSKMCKFHRIIHLAKDRFHQLAFTNLSSSGHLYSDKIDDI